METCASLAHFQQTGKEVLEFRSESRQLHQQHRDDLNDLQKTNLKELHAIQGENQAGFQRHDHGLAGMEANNVARHQNYLDEMAKLNVKMAEVLAQQQCKNMDTVKQWLAAGQQTKDDHASYGQIRRELPKTAQWILEHEAVKKWMAPDAPATPNLWINGIPGAGMSP